MTSDDVHPDHLDPRSVEAYFQLGARTAFDLGKEQPVRMVIDPVAESIELMTPAVGADPEVSSFERLSFSRIALEGTEWFLLRVDAHDMHYEGYVLIESVVDLLHSGATFRHSVSEALVSLKELLASRRRLTDDKVTGLIGELLVLQHVIGSVGELVAIEAWLGPDAAEHDFAFPEFEAEVKTTTSEHRVHVIGSETQLEASPHTPLNLVSIQITRAGAGERGFTLPSLVADIRASLDHSIRSFDLALEGLGWRAEDADLYRRTYQLRSTPRAYAVDAEFPAITSARLGTVVPNVVNVSAVSYRVDVTDLPFIEAGVPLHDFCEAPE